MICSFIGHSQLINKDEIESKLIPVLVDFIENRAVDTFYLGGYGDFDLLAARVVKRLKKDYPHIKSYLILAYYTPKLTNSPTDLYNGTIYPPLENIPKRYAILERNKWIVDCSDVVVAWVKYDFGGAHKTYEYAIKYKKRVINMV